MVAPRSRTLRLLLALALLGAPAALAGPLVRAHVAANAKWVAHLDMERFGPSQTCQSLLRDPNGGGGFQAFLARYRALLGIDPLKDLTQVTLYGEEVTGSRGVALIQGTMNPKLIVQRLSGYPRYQAKPMGGLTLHKWRDKSGTVEFNACFYASRLLIIGSDEPAMRSAVATLTGNQASLAGKNPALVVPPAGEGVFFTAVTKGYAGSSEEPLRALILRNTETAVLRIGETKGWVDANMVLSAVSPEAAFQIHQILNGLVVSASLAAEAGGLARLAELSEVARQDRTVTLKLHCPARDAASALAASMLSR